MFIENRKQSAFFKKDKLVSFLQKNVECGSDLLYLWQAVLFWVNDYADAFEHTM